MNITKIPKYFAVAEAVAAFSPDLETKVGSVLINPENGAILTTGYNGFCRGADDLHLPKTKPDKHNYVIHSEQNLIYNAARNGIKTEGGLLICTLSPCPACVRALIQAGITKVWFDAKHESYDTGLKNKDYEIEEKTQLNFGIKHYTKIILKAVNNGKSTSV